MKWREIRAGLIALAICLGLVEGCPLPPPDRTPAWQRGFVEPIRTVQHFVLAPVAWVPAHLRFSQRWAVYQAPKVDKFRLWVEGQDARGRWHVLFRAGDDAHQEDAALIDYSRPRGTWDPWRGMPRQYPLFAEWMTKRVLDRHADFIAARVRLENVRITGDGLVFTNTFVYPHVRLREDTP